MAHWLWLLGGDPHAVVEAETEDGAVAVVLRERAKAQASFAGRTEPNDADRKEAQDWYERRDQLAPLDDLEVLS